METSLPDVESDNYITAREELDLLKEKYDIREPNRGATIDDPDVSWRVRKPDYTVANLAYVKGKTMNHAAGSLEELVENLVKTWEMEASHKTDFEQWTTVDQEDYNVTYNGGPIISGKDAKEMGNYNWLFGQVTEDLWEQSSNFEASHERFSNAFSSGFPWEVLAVFSGPPHVTFSWRHWAEYNGSYTDPAGETHQGEGQLVELYGMARCTVSEDLKIQKIDIQYKPESFLKVLQGKISPEELHNGKAMVGPGGQCPYLSTVQTE